jgi:Uma2 family endonuclease
LHGLHIKNRYQTPYLKAPEICVEIVIPSNTDKEMQDKIQLYLAKGVQEVWLKNIRTPKNLNLKFLCYI